MISPFVFPDWWNRRLNGSGTKAEEYVLASSDPSQIIFMIILLVGIFVVDLPSGGARTMERRANQDMYPDGLLLSINAQNYAQIALPIEMRFDYFPYVRLMAGFAPAHSSQIGRFVESVQAFDGFPDFLHLLSCSMGARI